MNNIEQRLLQSNQIIDSDLISCLLYENKQLIQNAFGYSPDLYLRQVRFGADSNINVLVVHLDGMVDRELVGESIIKPISTSLELKGKQPSATEVYNQLRERLLIVSDLQEVTRISKFLSQISAGDCGVIVEGYDKALICNARGWRQRNLDEPLTEPSIRGSKEGFTETIRTNTSLIRRRIKDPRLWIEEVTVGRISKTTIGIVYIKSLAQERVVQEIRNRIQRIDTDSIQESGHLEEYIEDAPFSPFPTLLRTERPDKVCGALLGRPDRHPHRRHAFCLDCAKHYYHVPHRQRGLLPEVLYRFGD
jgi:spore germination protein KA